MLRTAIRTPARRSIGVVRIAAANGVRYASVSSIGVDGSKAPSSEHVADERRPLERPAHLSPEVYDSKRKGKLSQYAKVLKDKAEKGGFQSVEEMIEKQAKQKQSQTPLVATKTHAAQSGLTETDAKLAEDLLKRVEAEAARKHQTGDFSSGPGGMKSLSDIIDVERLQSDDASKIAQLWTQYHTLKNKLSAVIPARQYAEMIDKARRFPQFLLPLPRTIVGSNDETQTANVKPGERKNGYEMHYMEWGFLPFPTTTTTTTDAASVDAALSKEDATSIAKAPPSTVLFTPLAEYKLRQEYAQPVLVLTHYTDLALSKGIVLLRGEITEVPTNDRSTPTGVAAAVAASQAGETSQDKLDRLQAPLQSQGELSAQDAQLLTVTLQRFYLPKAPGVGVQPGEEDRQALLEAFHGDQDRFDIDKLCKCAFEM